MKKLLTYIWVEERLWMLLLLGSAALVVSAFVFEYGFGAKPCRMCWWQRYGHQAMVAIGLLGLLKMPLSFACKRLILLVPVLISGGVGVYQSLGQMGIVELPAFCQGQAAELSGSLDLLTNLESFVAAPDCSVVDFTILGLSFAQWNSVIMLGFAGVILASFYIKPSQK